MRQRSNRCAICSTNIFDIIIDQQKSLVQLYRMVPSSKCRMSHSDATQRRRLATSMTATMTTMKMILMRVMLRTSAKTSLVSAMRTKSAVYPLPCSKTQTKTSIIAISNHHVFRNREWRGRVASSPACRAAAARRAADAHTAASNRSTTKSMSIEVE